MNTAVLDTQKVAFVREILNESDTNIITMLMKGYQKIKNDAAIPPCQFSTEILKQEIAESLKDVKKGRLTTQKELEKEMMLWYM
jgi:hypothetical protein